MKHAVQAGGICGADQLDVDLIADLSRRELIDEGREATQWVGIKIYGRQPDYEDALRIFGKNVFGIVHRFTFLPWKQQGALDRRRGHVCLRWRPGRSDESDVFAIHRNKSRLA